MRTGTIATGLATLALIGAPMADAHPARLGEMQALGESWFPNHCAPVEVVESLAPLGIQPTALAWSESPLRGHGRCRMTLGPEWDRYGFAAQCTTVLHEYGHLAGLQHSDDPSDVMYPQARIQRPCVELVRGDAAVRHGRYPHRRVDVHRATAAIDQRPGRG